MKKKIPPKKEVVKAEEKEKVVDVNPINREALVKECDAQGLTVKHLVAVIKKATMAKKTIFDKFGQVHEEEDTAAQLKAATAALELRGELKIKEESGGVVNQFIDVKALIQQFNTIPRTKAVTKPKDG